MKDILTVMKFTISDMIKRKSFIISTIIILVLIVIGTNIPNIMDAIKGEDVSERLLVVDNENIFEGNLEALKLVDSGFDIEIGEATYDEIKQYIEEDKIAAALVIEPNEKNVKIRYIVESTTMMEGVPEGCVNAINTIYTSMQIEKLGLTIEQLQSLTPNFEFVLEQTEEKEVGGNVIAIMLLSMVLFYAIYFCAYQVSSSITTEKTSKIMETLVTSTSPRTIVLGKTFGVGIVGLVQLIIIVGTALISCNLFLEKEILESILDLSNVTPYLGVVTAIYFVLGYLVYSLLYALTGSTVSKPEDIQSANSPIAIISVAGFYLAYFTMMNPTSELNLFAALLPISSPFCMPFRVMMGIASVKEVLISITILILTILIIAKVTIKIYSNAILNYGTKMSFKDIINIYKDKKN